MSLPTRERELKPNIAVDGVTGLTSLPTRERELKQAGYCARGACCGSLPTRERELKRRQAPPHPRGHVAPHAGARIETGKAPDTAIQIKSLPTRERELKRDWTRDLL